MEEHASRAVNGNDGHEYIQLSSGNLQIEGTEIQCSRIAECMDNSSDKCRDLDECLNPPPISVVSDISVNDVPFPNGIFKEMEGDIVFDGSLTVTRNKGQELVSENAANVHSDSFACMRSSDTKSRFRAARADTPGAVSSSFSNGSIPLTEFDGLCQVDCSATAVERNRAFSSEGLVDPPCIVTAEVVESGIMMDQSERRRIVQETIKTIADQAVTAEVLQEESIKPSRKQLTVTLLLIFVSMAFVGVLVVVMTSRLSNSSEEGIFSPTPSPTSLMGNSVFRTTEELYQAVDAYRMLSWNGTDESSVTSSAVALRYGYPLSSWNVSLINDFSRLFDPTRFAPDAPWNFNEDLGEWDVSNAESFSGMFMNAYEFQGKGLENWNVGKVKDFSYMFMNSRFNGTISEWDTSNAESMSSMFRSTYDYNGNLSLWNVSQVQSLKEMFNAALLFQGIGLEVWDVGRVRDFSSMFSGATAFNGTLSTWDTSSAETLEAMFSYATIFNDDLSLWDVSKVTKMSSMFYSAPAYTGDGIASWDVSNVTSMDGMFSEAVSFNGDVSRWDVSRLASLSQMFHSATIFNRNLSAWNVAGIDTMDYLFFNAVYFNGDVSTWDVSNVNSFTAMFGSCSNFNGNLSSWNTVRAVNMNSMFDGASKFQGHGLSNWNTSNVVLFDNMFKDSASFTGNISSWDMSNAQSTTHMFEGASSFNSDLSQWNVSNVYDASFMFADAASFNYSLCTWTVILSSSVSLDRIFVESGCDDTADPTFNGTSFCGSCIK